MAATAHTRHAISHQAFHRIQGTAHSTAPETAEGVAVPVEKTAASGEVTVTPQEEAPTAVAPPASVAGVAGAGGGKGEADSSAEDPAADAAAIAAALSRGVTDAGVPRGVSWDPHPRQPGTVADQYIISAADHVAD